MSLRALLVLVVLLAAAVLALVWLGHRAEPAASAAPEASLLRTFTEEAMSEIDVSCEDRSLTLRRDASRRWRIVRPFDAEADPRRVREVISALQDAKIRKVIADGGADAATFGLAPAACTVHVALETKPPALGLRLGRSSPIGTERYAVVDDGRVVFTEGTLFGVVSREAESYREKRLFPVDAQDITRISLERPHDRVALAMVDGGCRVEAPISDLGATSSCESLARAVASLALSGPLVTQLPRDVRPERRLRVDVSARGLAAPMVAFVAAAGIEGKRLGFRAGGSPAGLLEESAVRELERPPESFRESRVVTFSSPDAVRITIERDGTTLRVERAGEASAWTSTAGGTTVPVDRSRVEALLNELRNLAAVGFGLGAPSTAATATIAVSGQQGELARITFGTLPPSAASNDASLWVTTPKRPGVVFRLAASALRTVPKTAADLARTKSP